MIALGMLVVLGLTGIVIASYTVSSTRATALHQGGASAFDLAEAGINDAASILTNIGNDPTSSALLPTAGSPATATVPSGTISYWGSYDSGSMVWTVTARGTVRNPNQAASIKRTMTQQFAVRSASSWKYIFMDNPAGCLNLASSVKITEPLYVRGNLCLDNSSQVTSTASPVTVAGSITVASGASATVGTSGAHLAVLHVGGGCRLGTGAFVTPCTSTQHVYADAQDSTIDTTIAKPAINLADWYSAAKPGPAHNCTTGSFPGGFDNDGTLNTSLPANVDLMPASAYSCVFTSGGTTVGELTWTPGGPGTLKVNGTIFFDGNINITGSTRGVYTGRAAVYASGTITIAGSSMLCGLWAGSACDWANWNPDTTMLVLIAGSSSSSAFTTAQSAQFQGGAYAVGDYTQGSSVKMQGPIQAQNITLGSSGQAGYPGQTSVPYGTPGGAVVTRVAGTWSG